MAPCRTFSSVAIGLPLVLHAQPARFWRRSWKRSCTAASCWLPSQRTCHPLSRWESASRCFNSCVVGKDMNLMSISCEKNMRCELTNTTSPRTAIQTRFTTTTMPGGWHLNTDLWQACQSTTVQDMVIRQYKFRHYFQSWCHLSIALQVFISSLAFAAAHLSGPDFIPLATLGAVLGATFLVAEGNLAVPTLAHGVYNAVILLSIAADEPWADLRAKRARDAM